MKKPRMIEWVSGTRVWYLDGAPGREGGLPAIERADGTREWYLDGYGCTEEEAQTAVPLAESCDYTLYRCTRAGETRYRAGCRDFNLSEARAHWCIGGSERTSFIEVLAKEAA